MTYEFTTDKVGSMKLQNFHGSTGHTFKLEGIDAQIADANIIIGGVNKFLSIVNFQNEYDPEDAVRTVNQNVVANEDLMAVKAKIQSINANANNEFANFYQTFISDDGEPVVKIESCKIVSIEEEVIYSG